MKKFEVRTHKENQHIRYMNIDDIKLTFYGDTKELDVFMMTPSGKTSVTIEQRFIANDLIHLYRRSMEGEAFPIIGDKPSRFHLIFEDLESYIEVCEFCEIEPDQTVCEKVKVKQ